VAEHPHAAPVLHDRRHGLQAQGLAPAARGADLQGQGHGQPPAHRGWDERGGHPAIDRPEDHWDELQVVFATSTGDVRRNALSDFVNVNRAGKIAMKLPDGVRLVNVRIASEEDDVLLVTDAGRAIRFSASDLRVFQSRSSTGVRGITLREDADHVVSMAVVRHFEATPRSAWRTSRCAAPSWA
jgi:DNA gyrase/topoisomerase IV subunit A